MSTPYEQAWQEKLGDKDGAIVYGLVICWTWGRVKLDDYWKLFSKVEDLKDLNAITGGTFLWHIQQILWDDLILHVARLTDPCGTKDRGNLTIQRIPGFCEDPELRGEIQGRVNDAVGATRFVRDWRNKRIGHTDLSQFVDSSAEPLNRPSFEQVAKGLDSIHAVLSHFSMRLLKEDIANRVAPRAGAGAFVAYTKQLATAVQYINSAIDPSGDSSINDTEVARDFLSRIGRRPNRKELKHVFDLREAAGRFK